MREFDVSDKINRMDNLIPHPKIRFRLHANIARTCVLSDTYHNPRIHPGLQCDRPDANIATPLRNHEDSYWV